MGVMWRLLSSEKNEASGEGWIQRVRTQMGKWRKRDEQIWVQVSGNDRCHVPSWGLLEESKVKPHLLEIFLGNNFHETSVSYEVLLRFTIYKWWVCPGVCDCISMVGSPWVGPVRSTMKDGWRKFDTWESNGTRPWQPKTLLYSWLGVHVLAEALSCLGNQESHR